RRNMYRADRAAGAQLAAAAAAPAEEDNDVESDVETDVETDVDTEETTAAPDSVIAVLGLDHEIVVRSAGLFDGNANSVVDALTHTVFRTLNARDRLLASVTG